MKDTSSPTLVPEPRPLSPKLLSAELPGAPLDDGLQWLDSSAEGLTGAEAPARLTRYGPNALRMHRVSALSVRGRQLRSALLGLLVATAVLSFFLGTPPAAG